MKITLFNRVLKINTRTLLLKAVGSVLFLTAPLSYAANQESVEVRLHYNCFVALDNDTKVVSEFVTSEKNRNNFVSSIVGKQVFFPDGVSYSTVTSVIECITKNESFESNEASEIDLATPR